MNSSSSKLLITTSRRTSNRVRSFVRELAIIMPEAVRLTRGSLSLEEILARARDINAKAVVIVTIHKGNPGRIRFITLDDEKQVVLFIESAALRREVYHGPKTRIHGLEGIYMKSEASQKTKDVANFIASLLDKELIEVETIPKPKLGQNQIMFWFHNLGPDKTVWTCYQTKDGSEVGPRIRIISVIME